MARAQRQWWTSMLSLVTTLALASMPLPDAIAPLRPDWVAVVLLYWSLMAPRHFSLFTAFWMGIALDTLSGALLGQNALALLVVVYLAEKFYLRLRVFPAGYPVGRVVEVTLRPEQGFAEVIAEPASALDREREVLLVWNEDEPGAAEPAAAASVAEVN